MDTHGNHAEYLQNNWYTELLLHITEVPKCSWTQRDSFLCSLHLPKKEFFFVTAETYIHKTFGEVRKFNSNCGSTKALCKDTIYILLFIAQLSFPDGFEKATTIRAFLWHSFAYQLLLLQDLTKALADLPAGTLMFSSLVPTFFPFLLGTEQNEQTTC